MVSARSHFVPALLALVVAGAAPGASAAVPSPANSIVDACVRVCPAGDMTLHVLVRDFANSPVPGSTILVDFSNCPAVFLCPLLGTEPYSLAGQAVLMTANAAGIADIPIRAGGTCLGTVNIYADGVLIASRQGSSSPDLDSNAWVNAVDQAGMAFLLGGPYTPVADLNCSGALEAGDQAVQNAHLGHTCGAVVPVWPRSWGRIKTLYR